MEFLVAVNKTTEAALTFLKLGPPHGLAYGECGYCLELMTDEEAFSASAHGADCAWIAFAKTAFPRLVVP